MNLKNKYLCGLVTELTFSLLNLNLKNYDNMFKKKKMIFYTSIVAETCQII